LALICSGHEDWFENNGELLTGIVAHEHGMKKMGSITGVVNVGRFAEPQRESREFNGASVFLKGEVNVPTTPQRRLKSGLGEVVDFDEELVGAT